MVQTESAAFSVSPLRTMPVVLLVDASGSMSADGKIETVNRAIGEMLESFANDTDSPVQISVAVIAFGGDRAEVHQRMASANLLAWSPMTASGLTPLGHALTLTRELLNDTAQVPHNAYYPTLVLLSDGQPTDDWSGALGQLVTDDRGRKTVRIAVAIGADADEGVLRQFVTDETTGVIRADEARHIDTFFRWLTMTVTSRTRAPSPNRAALLPPPSLENFEF